mgnify:CR=1 FL=1
MQAAVFITQSSQDAAGLTDDVVERVAHFARVGGKVRVIAAGLFRFRLESP